MSGERINFSMIGKSVSTVKDGAYDIPAGFYKIGHSKMLTSLDGDLLGVSGANIIFTVVDGDEQYNWEYMGEDPEYERNTYFFCSNCNNYNIRFIAKEIREDGFILGFTQTEINELSQRSKELDSLMPTLSGLASKVTNTECTVKVPDYITDECKKGIELLLDKLQGVSVKSKVTDNGEDVYSLDADEEAVTILKTLDTYEVFYLKM